MNIKTAKMVWHLTTPHHFECAEGCCCCCSTTLFFPEEFKKLPPQIKKGIIKDPHLGVYRAKPFENSGDSGCIFFKPGKKNCLIHNERPLRCRLFPYRPWIIGDEIVIVSEFFYPTDEKEPTYYRCYGLGKGPDITVQIEKLAREYLEKINEAYPKMMIGFETDNVNKLISQHNLNIHLNPVFKTWEDFERNNYGTG